MNDHILGMGEGRRKKEKKYIEYHGEGRPHIGADHDLGPCIIY